ncbi:MAG: alpha/beta hydrolase, partial [bacterium]
MHKLLPMLLFLFLTLPHATARATVTFTTYETPEGLTVYKEYLGDGGATAKLSSDQPKVFYHYPDKDYLLGGITVFIHTRDAVTNETFAPDLTKLKLVFEESGSEYLGSILGEVVYDNTPWGSTWPVTFLTKEDLSKEVWHKITITADDPDQERHKMWLTARDYFGGGLRGEEHQGSPGNFARGPISVFFEGTPKIPSYRPIVLIHGLGGHFTDWDEGGNKYMVKQALQEMLGQDPSGFEYPPEWIHNFEYGYIDPINAEPYYNYEGNIIEIAKEMAPVVDELSALSLENGGDGLVDVVGYSLGGVIVREYMRQNPDDHRFGKIVTVAAPHQGANLLELKDDILWWFGYGGYVLEEILTRALEPLCRPGQPLDTESWVMKQLWPGHPFIYNLNENPIEPEDGFYTIASD